MSTALASAALGLIGTPFRLHGRDPEYGLDCVGLVAEALRRAGRATVPPEGYSLRAISVAQWLGHAERNGLVRTERDADVVLCRTNPVQPHLLVIVPGGHVHAHAGLGRVAFLPGPLPWPVALQWRLAEKDT